MVTDLDDQKCLGTWARVGLGPGNVLVVSLLVR
jgi:hypothetical protein